MISFSRPSEPPSLSKTHAIRFNGRSVGGRQWLLLIPFEPRNRPVALVLPPLVLLARSRHSKQYYHEKRGHKGIQKMTGDLSCELRVSRGEIVRMHVHSG